MIDFPPLLPPGYRSEDLPQHAIHNRNQIVYLLRGLLASGALVSLTPQHKRWNIITSLLDLDDESAVFDRAHDEALHRQLLDGIAVSVSSALDGVPIVFATRGARAVEHEGREVFAIDLPETVYRLQRRDFFRVHLPVANPVLLRVPAQETTGIPAFTAPVIDLGMGGVAFTDDSGLLPLQVGTTLDNCRLYLPDIAPVEMTLEVRDTVNLPLRNGLYRLRAGCRFATLPNAYAVTLQRYIMELEQSRRQL